MQEEHRPTVSIGLPVFNGERFLREALDSILSQTFTDWELIISDNASTDSTPLICKQYEEKDHRIRYIRQPQNKGVFFNTNFIVHASCGEHFMLVGDDDVYEPTYIAMLHSLIHQDKDVGLAYSNYDFIDSSGRYKPAALRTFFRPHHSCFHNFAVFMRPRICLPMMMGIFRTALFKQALPFISFPRMTGDIDNLFLLRFLTFAKVTSTSTILFHYRLKDRGSSFPADWPPDKVRQTFYLFRHNRAVTAHVIDIINESNFKSVDKLILRLYAILTWLSYFSIQRVWNMVRRKCLELKP